MKTLLFISLILISAFADAQENCGFPVSLLRSGFEAGEQQPLVVLPIDGTPLSVNSVSPIEGATIPTGRLQVYGSLTGPGNIGVMVNGELALANASQFSTRPIVLEPGAQTITVILKNVDGGSISATSRLSLALVRTLNSLLQAPAATRRRRSRSS